MTARLAHLHIPAGSSCDHPSFLRAGFFRGPGLKRYTMMRMAMDLSRATRLSFTERIRFPPSSLTTRNLFAHHKAQLRQVLAHLIPAGDLADDVRFAHLAIPKGIMRSLLYELDKTNLWGKI